MSSTHLYSFDSIINRCAEIIADAGNERICHIEATLQLCEALNDAKASKCHSMVLDAIQGAMDTTEERLSVQLTLSPRDRRLMTLVHAWNHLPAFQGVWRNGQWV